IVGKASALQVEEALRTTRDENLRMIADTIAFLKAQGLEVFYDAEHFFDGYRHDAAYALSAVRAAADAGADCVVLCDTNGGTLPIDVSITLRDVLASVGSTPIGVHFHNDVECAVANSLLSVQLGAAHVQ